MSAICANPFITDNRQFPVYFGTRAFVLKEDKMEKKNRYQILFSVHTDNYPLLHIHFVMNTVSFVDGRKLHDNNAEQAAFCSYCEECYKQIKGEYIWVKKDLKSF